MEYPDIYTNVFQPMLNMEWPETEIGEIFPNFVVKLDVFF